MRIHGNVSDPFTFKHLDLPHASSMVLYLAFNWFVFKKSNNKCQKHHPIHHHPPPKKKKNIRKFPPLFILPFFPCCLLGCAFFRSPTRPQGPCRCPQLRWFSSPTNGWASVCQIQQAFKWLCYVQPWGVWWIRPWRWKLPLGRYGPVMVVRWDGGVGGVGECDGKLMAQKCSDFCWFSPTIEHR